MARHLAAAAVAMMALAGMSGARAEDYPVRPVTVIVPFAAGGPADITGRIVADIFARHLGQRFVVENVGVPEAPQEHFAPLARRPMDTRSFPVTWAPTRWRRRSIRIWATIRKKTSSRLD
jgi:hypothetical protein